jgi:hypothetical protein
LLGEEIEAMSDDDARRRFRERFDEIVRRKVAERLGEDGTLRTPPPPPVDNTPREPTKVWLATIDVNPGETMGIQGNVEDAIAALQEHSFREAYDPETYHRECEAARLRQLFALPDRSSEKFP